MTPSPSAYGPRRPSRSRFTSLRGMRCHVREWGPADGPLMVMVHGARDTAASFQFVVDAMKQDWRILAPDLRGHGQSDWTPGAYWLTDFLQDLDLLLDEAAGDQPVLLVGHSMGGNLTSVYAGLKPERVRRLVLLDSLGPSVNRLPVPVALVLRAMLDERTVPHRRRPYPDHDAMAERLMQSNRRLDRARAGFLAEVNAQPLDGGGLAWPHDPAFSRTWPTLHSVEEWGECWSRITAPVLCLTASDLRPNYPTSMPEALSQRGAYFRDLTVRAVPDTGHNLHYDAPEIVAQSVEALAIEVLAIEATTDV